MTESSVSSLALYGYVALAFPKGAEGKGLGAVGRGLGGIGVMVSGVCFASSGFSCGVDAIETGFELEAVDAGFVEGGDDVGFELEALDALVL